MLLRAKIFTLLSFLFLFSSSFSQTPVQYDAAEIQLALKKLNVLGSVLYVAAHPDDENTKLIAWLSKEKLVNTGYLSLTRGDGGQNLIGPEIRESLGVIRTQELLQARRIDGGKQFFTRANDFGFSKNYEETFDIWEREEVLADMVWVIRNFKPDIIITRFSTTPGGTHGHHTASAILAEEAFKAAGDKKRFPEQLKYIDVWQPQRLLWNTTWWFYGDEKKFDKTGLLPIDVGGYSPLLGNSYTEIAARSRSMHQSQGFGAPLVRGSEIEYLQPIIGGVDSLFAGIEMTWASIEGGKAIEEAINQCIEAFEIENPAKISHNLVQIYQQMKTLPQSYWKEKKIEEVKTLIKACLGLYLEVTANSSSSAPGESINIKLEATNRSQVPVMLTKISSKATSMDSVLNKQLAYNHPLILTKQLNIPETMEYSQPYWLKETPTIGMYVVEDQTLIGKAEDTPSITFDIICHIGDEAFSYEVPLVYKYTDPAKGELYQPFEITPPVFMNLEEEVYIFPDNAPKNIKVVVGSGTAQVKGELSLEAPEGWSIAPKSITVAINQRGGEESFSFEVTPPAFPSEAKLKAVLTVAGKRYDKSKIPIEYDHIPKQTLYPEAAAKIVRVDLKKKGERIGYLMGAGDNIPISLQQVGYKVDLLNDGGITLENLKQYDAIILGIRAYNTIERLKFHQPILLKYVKAGGTLIVQYNTNHQLVTEEIGPYPLSLSRDRVTVEDAPVRILLPEHPVLNFPNKITAKDFEGWVQERGLYFPNQWSSEYKAPLSSNDPGESPKDGGLLIAPYGKGYYIYTGYSWFRELPAGVPGAYRLFTNMISIGKKGKQ